MKTAISRHLKEYGILYWTGILSVWLFIMIYDTAVLDPAYTDWLMSGGDPTQHYLGFALFKNAPWQFQIGMMNTSAYPFSESIIFTDSIPLAAMIGKLCTVFTSGSFQYFGIYGFLCFVLQGVLSCLIFKNFTDSPSQLIPASLLFVFSPILLRRIFWHTSLSSHFLILLALLFLTGQHKYFKNVRSACIAWGILGALCASIHIYFLAMCGILLLCFVVKDFFIHGRRTLLPLAGYIGVSLFSVWILGGFSSGMDDGAPGLGYYSFNLNGFFNPMDWSSFFQNAPVYADGQYEGFAYLGLGCILLLAAALLLVLSQLFTALWHSKKIPVMLRSHRNLLLYGAAFLIIVFFAASNELSFGSALLLKVPLPQKLLDLWGTFRASGRMIWPAVYMLMLFSIVICIRKLPKRLSVILLFCCLFLQILDLKDMLYEKHQEFTSRQTYESCLQNEFWTDILTERSLQHIVFYDKENLTQEQLYSFAEYAARNQFTINPELFMIIH